MEYKDRVFKRRRFLRDGFILSLCCGVIGLALAGQPVQAVGPVLPIKHWQTDSGVPVYFVQARRLPMFDVQVVFDAGSARDGTQPGIAALTGRTLVMGAGQRSADQVAEVLDDLGALYGHTVGRDMAVYRLRSRSTPAIAKAALAVFADVLSQPTFNEADFAREKADTRQAIKARDQYADRLAYIEMMRTLYAGHPYGHAILGQDQDIAKLSRDGVRQFYQTHYTQANAMVVLVGDLSNAQARSVAAQLVQRLPKGQPLPALPEVRQQKRPALRHIPFPAQQTTLLMGETGAAWQDADLMPLLVGNHILGGAVFTSRLWHQVREQRGLAYGISSHFVVQRRPGPFLISLKTRQSAALEAQQVVEQTLQSFIENRVTAKELAQAKRAMIGQFGLSFASNQAIADQLVQIAVYGLPLDYLDCYRPRVQAVTAEAIQAAFSRRFAQRKPLLVTAGKAQPKASERQSSEKKNHEAQSYNA